MLTKVLIFLAVLIGVFVVARMGAASATRPAGGKKKRTIFERRAKKAEDMIPCPVCGSFTARGEACDCGGAPTP